MSATVQVILGPTYEPTMWDLRKSVTAARKASQPLVFVRVSSPIVSEVVEVAIESGSLYMIGVRAGDGGWFEFAPDSGEPRPRLPNSRWIMAGDLKALSTYRALRLGWHINAKPGAKGTVIYSGDPITLLRFFRGWDGRITGFDVQISVCVLIFAICEALRFRSIENTCARWIRPVGGGSSEQTLAITKNMLDTAQNWHDRATSGDPDVWTWPPELPDPIIS